MHEIGQLMRENPFGTFVCFLATIWAIERTMTAWAESRRPIIKCECECSCCVDDEE